MSLLIPEEDRDYFGFITHFGLYRWKRVPYGWRNAGANFCYLMDQVLAGLKYQILVSFVDDICVYWGSTFEEHLRALNVTLDRLQTWGLRLSIEKCYFLIKNFDYLGFTVSRDGVRPSHKNVEKIVNCPCDTAADIRRFLGLGNFYRRWISAYAQVVQPLYDNLKITWSKRNGVAITEATDRIKEALSSYPLLRHPDFNRRFYLASDGAACGYGASLHQKDDTGNLYNVAYASTRPLPSHKKLVGPQLEAAAACWAMTKFRHYLIGREFTLLTDQIVLKHLRAKTEPSGVIAQFALESLEFDFVVQHVKGSMHILPDFLSRPAARNAEIDHDTFNKQERVYMTVNAEEEEEPLIEYSDWLFHQMHDPYIQEIRNSFNEGSKDPRFRWYRLKNKLVVFVNPSCPSKQRVEVPASMQRRLFDIMHRHFAHRGARPVLKRLGNHFHWPCMSRDIRRWTRSCKDCQRRKKPRPMNAGLTKSLLVNAPGQVFFMDFSGGTQGGTLPASPEGFVYLLIVMDAFTRYVFGVPLKTKSVVEIADRLMAHVFAFTGFPRALHSDNDTVLCSEAMALLFQRLGVRRSTITVRHPQGNSMVERFMRYLNVAFTLVLPQYTAWVQVLPIILLAYRALPHETTGFSPHFLMTGREPLLPIELSTEEDHEISLGPEGASTTRDYASLLSQQLRNTFKTVRERQDRASRNNAARRDTNRSLVVFKDKDPVLYYEPAAVSGHSGRPTKDEGVEIRVPTKWRFPWSGPHVVVGRKSDNVYYIYHTTRKITLAVNVDSLVLYHPFKSLDVDFDHVRVNQPSSVEVAPPAPLQPLRGPESIVELKVGDLCVVRLAHDGWEPLVVLKYLRPGPEDRLVFQWLSNVNLLWHLDVRMREQTWLLTWWQDSTQQYYHSPRKLHPQHCEYTTEHTGHTLRSADILLFDFKLRSKYRLPSRVAEAALEKWRAFEAPVRITNPRTYELDSVLNDSTLVPCNCTRKGCACNTLVPHDGQGLRVCLECEKGKCLLHCICLQRQDTFEMYQCDMCLFTTCEPFEKCYQKDKPCSGVGRAVLYCSQCRHRVPAPTSNPRMHPTSSAPKGTAGPAPSK